MRGIVLFLSSACSLVLYAQSSTDLFHKAPPAVDEALRARIAKFYQLHVEGKYRQAEALVAEDTKDFFYTANKPKYLGFEIKSIEYSDNFTKAKAIVVTQRIVMMPGIAGKPMPVPEPSRWKLVDGEWYWYISEDDLYNTPFGRLKPQNGATAAAGALPVIPSQEEMNKTISAVAADKTQVALQAEKESSAQFLIANGLAGPVNLTLDSPHGPGFESRLDRAELPPGGKATLTVEWKPGLRPAPKAIRMVVRVQPTNQVIPLRVQFEK